MIGYLQRVGERNYLVKTTSAPETDFYGVIMCRVGINGHMMNVIEIKLIFLKFFNDETVSSVPYHYRF